MGWMDRTVFLEWLQEPRAITCDPYDMERTIFLDNCSGHGETDPQKAAPQKLKTSLRFLPPNASD